MINFDDVTIRYDGADTPVLREVSLQIPEGDLCLLIGPTGVGKSTFLGAINGLVPHFTGGVLAGQVRVAGRSTAKNRPRELADVVGYVGQDPLTTFVTDTVVAEIAYGMEQLGMSALMMRKRIEETLDIMGIAELRNRPLLELSGGQQQRVAIAAVLAAQPKVLVLDEPTSALDPTAAQDVLAAISQLVHDCGLTVILAEHRLERVMQAADSIIWLPGDGHAVHGDPGEVLQLAADSITPPLSALSQAVGWKEVPLSVRDARRRIHLEHIDPMPPIKDSAVVGASILRAEKLTVSYGTTKAVNSIDLNLNAGTVLTIMGRNGAGKTSLLWALQGGTASQGELDILREDPRKLSDEAARKLICLVPQNAADLLYLPTVSTELSQADNESNAAPGTASGLLLELGIEIPADRDPRDLSEGQRLALVLAIQLAANPAVLLLDEPTRGLDYATKTQLVQIVTRLKNAGLAIAISTHDVEFAAAVSNRILIMADGDIIADGDTREVCTSSVAFAPQMTKIFAPIPILTPTEVAAGLRTPWDANDAESQTLAATTTTPVEVHIRGEST